jgi:hypothetical protein
MFWLLVRVSTATGLAPGSSEKLPRDNASYENADGLERGALLHRVPPREGLDEGLALSATSPCADVVHGTFPLIVVVFIIRCEGAYDGAPFADYRTPVTRRAGVLSFYAS